MTNRRGSTMEASDRGGRHIPEHTKRAVRKRCGFGCVVCGLPIYHYDHIDEFATVRQHDSYNLALLCPNHHQDKSSGRLSKAAVKHHVASPANKAGSFTSGHWLSLVGEGCLFRVGASTYGCNFGPTKTRYVAFRLHGREVMSFDYEGGI